MATSQLDFTKLKNEYYGLRHGFSKANELNLIVSDPRIGCENYGLTDLGKSQAKQAAEEFFNQVQEGSVVIYSSDFLRTRETSENFVSRLKEISTKLDIHIIETPLLRERYFGDMEGKSSDNYEIIWKLDEKEVHETEFNTEPVPKVLNRISNLILEVESDPIPSRHIIFVSHGDALQILQTAFCDTPSSKHRSLPHWSQGEIKKLSKNIVQG
ncbi:hypothetical protein K7432_010206 [Basidiobolus ranarum]|uniref:Phosphoglycerate mutase n=1 Tax=Basidiobolus ranarum TaxID=34480 RepID=A0ABR2WP51_9FUNG